MTAGEDRAEGISRRTGDGKGNSMARRIEKGIARELNEGQCMARKSHKGKYGERIR